MSASAIDVAFPDIARWTAGNTGTPYVWRFTGHTPGPHVVVQALTHGNEVCGAIALDWLLAHAPIIQRGTLTAIFANVEAYASWDPDEPFSSRCIAEDFNRLWSDGALDTPRDNVERRRARALRPCYDAADYLLDLHSMVEPCPPLALAGAHAKGVALARALGIPRDIVIDRGHAAGKRLRDYAFFDDENDPRSALLIECGQHWERSSVQVAKQCLLRFVAHFGMVAPDFVDAHLDTTAPAPQRTLTVTDVITINTDAFAFALPVSGLGVIPKAGTLLAHDGTEAIYTPYDDCVLIMPTRKPQRGETAVRLGCYGAQPRSSTSD
jgi:predicted deacylase